MMREGIVYMRDINDAFHTIYFANSEDTTWASNNKLIAQDAGISIINGELDQNGNFSPRSGIVDKELNGVVLFATDTQHDDANQPRYVVGQLLNAYLRNPAAAGWSYNTFGVFEDQELTALRGIHRGYQSIGVMPKEGEMPEVGKATYSGVSHAYYQDNQVTMRTVIDADFGKRELTFNTNNAELHTFEARGHLVQKRDDLNLTGTGSWSKGATSFKGEVKNQGGNLSGTLEGSFYGPAAAEVGGVFGLQNENGSEQYIGGYGAKRP
ncbi:transferrin-binding protein-like solute binding protein [Suttonella ornithocola]|uniref:Transferrin-binding protein B C-lobe/N-lobe beta-barrel domain-containing protein n=1 Tax=Suttonella ornithocola TaxID=279832 RepID=A0A380MT88_9GAMM|nr:transferrin-binding protein-like solute binding protein [Suttonella ornithocola]SUO94931.1 Uncharacterised protein [Suttonella ornithocola]